MPNWTLARYRAPFVSLIAFSLVGMPACATIGLKNARQHDEPVHTSIEQVPLPSGHGATATLDGTTLKVSALQLCDVRETSEVRRTTTSEHANQSPVLDWTLGALGAGLAASGTLVLINASSVYANDSNSRQYNPIGPTGATAIGASLTAVGVGLATIAIVDVVRSSGQETRAENVSVPGIIVEHGVGCKGRPLVGAPVVVALSKEGDPLEAGKTGPDGTLTVDLETAVPKDASFGKDATVEVRVSGNPAANVKLATLYASRGEAAWKQIDPKICAQADSSTACDPVRRYVDRYAEGVHTAEARALLSEAESKLTTLRDDEQWAKINPSTCSEGKPADVDLSCSEVHPEGRVCETVNLPRINEGSTQYVDCCVIKAGSDVDDFRTACNALHEYVKTFPQGRHVTEARAALKRGDATLEKWRLARTKQRKKEMDREARAFAAEEQKGRAEQAAEQRKQQQEERQQRQEEAQAAQKAKACVAKKCTQICSVRCPYSDRCFTGCRDLCRGSHSFDNECGENQ